jgi:hypothetical protein
MNTRLSPRNQETLWRELGNVQPVKKLPTNTVESLERQLAAAPNHKTRRMIERELVTARRRAALSA